MRDALPGPVTHEAPTNDLLQDTPPVGSVDSSTGRRPFGLSATRVVQLATACVLILSGAVGGIVSALKNQISITSLTLASLGVTLAMPQLHLRRRSRVDEYADQIRRNVDAAAGQPSVAVYGSEATVHIHPNGSADAATVKASQSLQKQEAILREIYTQGLAQAKASFRVSIIFAVVGASFLLSGVGLAIIFAQTAGQQYVSIVAGTAGIVVSLTSSLFYVQSNRARSNMVRQGALLREESQEDRKLTAARELAAAIEETTLRDNVRAKLSLVLLDDHSPVGYTSDDLVRRLEKEFQRDERRLLAQIEVLRALIDRGSVDVSDIDFGKLMKDWVAEKREEPEVPEGGPANEADDA